jgi:hypothetical protein
VKSKSGADSHSSTFSFLSLVTYLVEELFYCCALSSDQLVGQVEGNIQFIFGLKCQNEVYCLGKINLAPTLRHCQLANKSSISGLVGNS